MELVYHGWRGRRQRPLAQIPISPGTPPPPGHGGGDGDDTEADGTAAEAAPDTGSGPADDGAPGASVLTGRCEEASGGSDR